MQTPPSVLSWPQVLAASLIALFSAILGYLYKSKKLPSEVHKTDSEADYLDAQAGDLRLRTKLSALEMFSEMAADLGEAQFEKVTLRKELERANERVKVLEIEVQKFKAERMLKQLEE